MQKRQDELMQNTKKSLTQIMLLVRLERFKRTISKLPQINIPHKVKEAAKKYEINCS